MGAFLGAQELQNIFVISQFLTIISHWSRVEGVVALVGREQGICKFGSDVYNFLVVFLLQFWSTNLHERMVEKAAVGGRRRRRRVPSGVRTNPPNQVILPPSSFFLKSPRICFRGLHFTEVMRTFFTDESKKLSATPILRGGGPARTENNDFQQKHRRVVLR